MGNVSFKEIEEFFFEASLKGYVNEEIPKTTILEMPGSKVYRYERGDLLYVDSYFVGESGKTFGSTVIWDEGRPVWYMQYHGSCIDRKVIPFLKRALGRAYKIKTFVGGRGPITYAEGNLMYRNDSVREINNFRSFLGHETIYESVELQREVLILGHDYNGGILLAGA